jgi:hypothetical protein
VIAIAVMLVGIGFVALLTAVVADRFIRRDTEQELAEHDEVILASLQRIEERLDRLEQRG